MDNLFANIGRITDLLPVLLFILFAFKSKNEIHKGLWVIFFYCLLVALNDNVFFQIIPESYSKVLFSSFTLLEYFALSAFFWLYTENKIFQDVLSLVLMAFTLFISFYFIFAPFKIIDSVPIGVETILFIGLSVYFLYEEVNKSFELIYNKPAFWIITGVLIYLAGCFFIYLYANHVPFKELQKIWFVTFIFTSIKNIFISIAFWLALKDARNNNTSNPHEYQPYLN